VGFSSESLFDMPLRSRISDSQLAIFIDAARVEYLRRKPYDDLAGGLRRVNTLRLVAGEVFEGMPHDEQLAVVSDTYRLDADRLLRDRPEEVFEASDSIASHIFDLVCEVAWQELVGDISLRIEDEIRQALAEGWSEEDQ
jgi:hypothetical protein